MLLHQFPPLDYLKQRIRREWDNGTGWPSLILNVKTQESYRPDIRGPLSLFMNVSGTSRAGVDGRMVLVEEGYFYLTNPAEHYSLEIESAAPVETFNVHFGQDFLESAFTVLSSTPQKLMDGVQCTDIPGFHSRLYRKTPAFESKLSALRTEMNAGYMPALRLEEHYFELLSELLDMQLNLRKESERLPAMRATTREELYRRLNISLDYLHTYYMQDISLEDLAGLACLSRFHYLRLFRQAYGKTPHQYLTNLRIQKGQHLLKEGKLGVAEIGLALGYENQSSFSRAFQKATAYSPTEFRNLRL